MAFIQNLESFDSMKKDLLYQIDHTIIKENEKKPKVFKVGNAVYRILPTKKALTEFKALVKSKLTKPTKKNFFKYKMEPN